MRRLTELMVTALRDHLATGAPPRLPDYALPLWAVFVSLTEDARPMTIEAIAARGQMMGLPLALRHIHIIRALDRAWRGAGPLPELTGDAFDVMAG